LGTDGVFFIGKSIGEYNLYVGRFVECISFEWRRNNGVWGAKKVATYKDQILMFIWTM
jgi:hypothetical protein